MTEPESRVILYGSYARGDYSEDSDIDLLILVKKNSLSPLEKTLIKYPLYDIEFETGKIISPLVLTENEWNTTHQITQFFENVTREGIAL